LTPDALALIEQGNPKPQTPSLSVTVDSVKAQEFTERKLPTGKAERQPVAAIEEMDGVALVQLGFRVRAAIPPALRQAAMDRKTKRIRPCTQQGIIDEALTAWFKKNGYQL
jgi:hypothetical protein